MNHNGSPPTYPTPRPWHCTDRLARYCPHHGDCTCPAKLTTLASCPVHGFTSDHPRKTPTMIT